MTEYRQGAKQQENVTFSISAVDTVYFNAVCRYIECRHIHCHSSNI
jgi:hypothetical protein